MSNPVVEQLSDVEKACSARVSYQSHYEVTSLVRSSTYTPVAFSYRGPVFMEVFEGYIEDE